MTDKIVIYGKKYDEHHVPIPIPMTVRIKWLANGEIKPQMYWTPDGTCYKVITLYERVQLALLKDGGEGLRFKIKAEIIETQEPYSEILHTQHETYLYLADKRFSERNIIDDRYVHACKEYIPVTLDVFPDGDYELICFWVRDERYMVEETSVIEPRGSFQAGGVGIWHKVRARLVNEEGNDPDPKNVVQRLAALYLELNKWFVVKLEQ